ncbi:CotO family spore coat protein [Terribacillus sp. AE2B 122]|uniref:CotO family spore coat protein n=1 Tax=Terribacillus sp. AE2B 122 TaxID=1331902 RepID=UPI00158233DE|nr:CotO family spore coat protein [Terribacillus sp. AE2B 122]
MSKEKVRRQQPVLFIAQPKLDLPIAEMQQAYRTAKGKKTEVVAAEEVTEEVKPEAVVPKEEVSPAKKKIAPSNRKVNFKDLLTAEKVDYLLNLPSQIPRMKCELVTTEGSLIGIIASIEGDLIQFKSIRRPFKREVKLEDILDIKILGF